MPGRLDTLAAWGLVATLMVVLAGCGPDNATLEWIGQRAAVVHCGVSGRMRMAPVLLDLPVPKPPTGLYARALDPMALNDLGYQREAIACASFEVPPAEAIDAAATDLAELMETYRTVNLEAARIGGRCVCEIADALNARNLVSRCVERPVKAGCDTQLRRDEVESALQPMRDALASASLPMVHWRLSGRSDRSGWFASKVGSLLDRHTGGSTVFLRGQPIPARDNHQLVRTLFEQQDVVAVVRQDAGRALLVAREVGRDLVLDHFAYYNIVGRYHALLPHLDNSRAESYVAALAKPSGRYKPSFDPNKGNIIEVDRGLLLEADRLLLAMAPLGGAPYAQADELWEQPTVLVDHVALQAPFGKDGQILDARFRLTEAGNQWAHALTNDLLSPTLEELDLAGVAPEFELPGGRDFRFFVRGTPANAVLFQGIHRVPPVMREIEMNHPSTVHGKLSAWQFDLPSGGLDAYVGGTATGLRSQFAARPYVVNTRFVGDDRRVLAVEFHPR